MLNLKNVTKRYGNSVVLRNFSLSLDEPGICCLLGRNGAGKTTLLKSIAGWQRIDEGSIVLDGKEVSPGNLESGVSYVENFARHFNLPVRKLLDLAAKVNPEYDRDFSMDMMDRFELDGKKKFNNLSLGMKTMVSTIICLSSERKVILLDEPVLGFDAIMRLEFYRLLEESIRRHPRIIIVSTHIIEEIAGTVEKLIIIDRGRLLFSGSLDEVADKAYSVSGLCGEVESAVSALNVIGIDRVGTLATAYVYDRRPDDGLRLDVRPMSLQDFFIQFAGHREVRK